jgi:hypothetical protein
MISTSIYVAYLEKEKSLKSMSLENSTIFDYNNCLGTIIEPVFLHHTCSWAYVAYHQITILLTRIRAGWVNVWIVVSVMQSVPVMFVRTVSATTEVQIVFSYVVVDEIVDKSATERTVGTALYDGQVVRRLG